MQVLERIEAWGYISYRVFNPATGSVYKASEEQLNKDGGTNTYDEKVLLVSLNNYEREMLESKIVKKQVIHYSVREEWMAFLNIYHNWQDICFPKKNVWTQLPVRKKVEFFL